MILPPAKKTLFWAMIVVAGGMPPSSSLAKPAAEETAREVDRLLAEEVFTPETQLAPRVDDATYLRRVWLDITGDIPTPEHITAFLLDPSADKRERVVAELLTDPHYGQNWARYWRDVVLSRKLEARAQIVANPLVVSLTDKFNENESWDKIAAEFITATGDVRENGATAIQMAQEGRTEEITAEMSRIFLGIQIQCAQCHDHKTDRWTRAQFHELAAFFPRIAVRQVQSPVKRSFEIVADDRAEPPRRPKADANNRRGKAEHFMPDLEDPTADGTRMQPRFFLTSAKLPFGTPDAERRGAAAKWMTQNPWFATAFVNRMWGELVGEGFYQPIDDMGPDRKPSAPKTVEHLSHAFAANDFDIKWLFRTICATEAYQRESRPRREVNETPFTATIAQPLRSDQLFDALLSAIDAPEPEIPEKRRAQLGGGKKYGPDASVRTAFEVAFGYDPSDPRETINASIPQALALMNGSRINLAVRSNEGTMLGGLLKSTKDDRAVVDELYLRTLSRQPTEKELTTALAYCGNPKVRNAVFEDLLWALLNSSEFSHRR